MEPHQSRCPFCTFLARALILFPTPPSLSWSSALLLPESVFRETDQLAFRASPWTWPGFRLPLRVLGPVGSVRSLPRAF